MTLAAVAEAATFVDLVGLLVAGEVHGMAVDHLSRGFYSPAVWRNTPHTHSFHEVCLAYAGSDTFTVEGKAHPVAAGDLFVARPGEVYEIVSHPEAGLGIAFWGFALDTTALPEGPGWWDCLLRRERPLVSRRLGSLPAIVSALAAEAASPRSGVDAQVRALGSALVIETARAFAAPEDLARLLLESERPVAQVARECRRGPSSPRSGAATGSRPARSAPAAAPCTCEQGAAGHHSAAGRSGAGRSSPLTAASSPVALAEASSTAASSSGSVPSENCDQYRRW